MSDLDKRTFIIAFVRGFKECNSERFSKNSGKQMLQRVRGVNQNSIDNLSEIKAIYALLYDRVFDGENFNLGEILDALGKTEKEAEEIRDKLNRVSSWRM